MESFLQIATEHEQKEDEKEFVAFLNSFGATYSEDLKIAIAGLVAETEVASNQFGEYVEYPDGAKILEVDLVGAHIINVYEHDSIEVFITADATFNATAHFHDNSDAIYDKEDDTFHGGEDREEEIQTDVRVTGVLEFKILDYPPIDWDDLLLEHANLEPSLIEVDLEAILFPIEGH